MRRRGISLVEVLIAMGIIVILAGLVFTALGPTRESARQAACMNNLRQIYVALQAYAADNPGAVIGATVTVPPTMPLQPYGLTKELQYCPDSTKTMRVEFGSTYYWSIVLGPEPNNAFMKKYRDRKIAAMEEQMGEYIMIQCPLHDQLYYQPREQDIDPTLLGAFRIRLRANGSVTKERDPDAPRTREFLVPGG